MTTANYQMPRLQNLSRGIVIFINHRNSCLTNNRLRLQGCRSLCPTSRSQHTVVRMADEGVKKKTTEEAAQPIESRSREQDDKDKLETEQEKRSHSNKKKFPLPPPPEKPLPDDCCGSGCVRCVWDVYYDELEAYNKLYNQSSNPDFHHVNMSL